MLTRQHLLWGLIEVQLASLPLKTGKLLIWFQSVPRRSARTMSWPSNRTHVLRTNSVNSSVMTGKNWLVNHATLLQGFEGPISRICQLRRGNCPIAYRAYDWMSSQREYSIRAYWMSSQGEWSIRAYYWMRSRGEWTISRLTFTQTQDLCTNSFNLPMRTGKKRLVYQVTLLQGFRRSNLAGFVS